MKPFALAAALALAAYAAPAGAGNIVTNGSFEIGRDGLMGWSLTGGHAGYPVVSILYGAAAAYPTGAFGEAVAANTVFSNTPDAVGRRAAYFVDDFALGHSLSQQVYLDPGRYQIGFDAYAPSNGYRNPGDAQFTAIVAGVPMANYLISSGPATTWQNFYGHTEITTAGLYDVSFTFTTKQAPSKDVVIDRVYIVGCDDGSCVRTPEPASAALLGAALVAMGVLHRRRRRR